MLDFETATAVRPNYLHKIAKFLCVIVKELSRISINELFHILAAQCMTDCCVDTLFGSVLQANLFTVVV